MKIALISLTEELFAPSLRYLSAYLKKQGHETTLIFLPWNFTDADLNSANSFRYPFPRAVLEQLAEKCHTFDLIGISLMTCHFDNAIRITKFLRQTTTAPIIWGGIHPTIRPAECLRYADMVCVGEGEHSVLQLAQAMASGQPWASLSIPGILTHATNLAAPLVPSPILEDLNQLPLPDYDLNSHYILYEGRLIKLNSALLSRCLSYGYQAMFSRGCPYSCSYCCNNALRCLYQRKLPVRWRNVSHRIEELEAAIRLMPDLRAVGFADDAFLAQPDDVLKEFIAKYREKIRLPFSLLTTPRSVSEEKIAMLADAGLYHIGIGLQSGSERILKHLYARPETLNHLILAGHHIKRAAQIRKKQILTRYDLILDNPWETEQDIEATIRLCANLEKPYNLATFSLTLYPGTQLYEKARSEGLITDDLTQVYRSSQLLPQRTYLNGVFSALSANAPKWLVLSLLWKPLRRRPFWVSLPYKVAVLFEALKLARGLGSFAIRGEWKTITFLLKPGWGKLASMFHPHNTNNDKVKFSGAPGQAPDSI